jgi:hypothetical protein
MDSSWLGDIRMPAHNFVKARERIPAMKNLNALSGNMQGRILPVAGAIAVAFMAAFPQPAFAGKVTPPDAPANIRVPAGHHAFLKGHAFGTQNYVCLPSASATPGVAYVLFTPQAILFDEDDHKELTTHFFSPNPFETNTNPALVADGQIRPTWHHSRDSSTVWAKVRPADPNIPDDRGDSSTDRAFVEDGAIAWLKLTVTGTDRGPGGGDTLAKTTFIQRVNTSGGVAPSTGCRSLANVGNQAFVDYTAYYFFYTNE